jgi:hypothetical protein
MRRRDLEPLKKEVRAREISWFEEYLSDERKEE